MTADELSHSNNVETRRNALIAYPPAHHFLTPTKKWAWMHVACGLPSSMIAR